MKKLLFVICFVIYFLLFPSITKADWVDGIYAYNTSGVYSTDEYFALVFKTAIKDLDRQHRFQVLLYDGPLDSDNPNTSARIELILGMNCNHMPAINVDFEIWRPSKPGEEIKVEGKEGPVPGVAWRPALIHFLVECNKWGNMENQIVLMKEALGPPYGPKEGSGKKGKGWVDLKLGGKWVKLNHNYELDQGFIKFDRKWYYQKECQMYQ